MARYKLVRTISAEGQESKEILNKGSLLYLAAKAFDFQHALKKEHYEIEFDENNELNFTAILRDQEQDDIEGDVIASIRYEIIRLTKDDEKRPKFDPKTTRAPKPSKADELREKKKKDKKKAKKLQVIQTSKTVNGTEKAFTNNPLLYEGGDEEVSSFCSDYCERMVNSGASIATTSNGFVVTRQIASGELKLTYEIKAV